MANQEFKIQSDTVSLNGVNLSASTDGKIVVPGVTRSTGFRVEEVEEIRRQTQQFGFNTEVVVVDMALYNAIIDNGDENHFADFTAPTDDEGYIDEIQVNGRGTYSSVEALVAENNDMYAYIGAGSASDRPIVPEDWVQIPFRPKLKSTGIESDLGGGNANTGDVTFDGQTVIGDGALNLAPNSTSADNGQYFRVRTGDQDSHLHFDTNNNSTYDLYLGDDSKYVRISKDGEIVLGVNDAWEWDTQSGSRWTFETDGTLTFPDGSVQTTAYTGQSSTGSGLTYYVMANNDGNVLTSTDGVTWSAPVNITNGTNISQVATNGTNIVYVSGAIIGYTSFINPTLATELTMVIDGVTDLVINQIIYGGGYFVVAGTAFNGNYNIPVYGYSSNGISWTYSTITDTALQGILANNASNNCSFSDVDYNGEGFNFAVVGDSVGGGVYTTDITATFTPENYFGMVPGNQVAWNGSAWFYFNNNVGSGSNTSIDPRVGNWNGPFNPWGTSSNDIGYMLGGESSDTMSGGGGVLAISDSAGHVSYSTNNGYSWTVVVPIPYTTTFAGADLSDNNIVIGLSTSGELPATSGEKIVISGANESQYNGSFYIGGQVTSNGGTNFYKLYTDSSLITPVDTTDWPQPTGNIVLSYSHGQYIDAMDYANGYFYVGNDNEQVARAATTNMNSWSILDDQQNAFSYWNDFYGYTSTVSSSADRLVKGLYTASLDQNGLLNLPGDLVVGTLWPNEPMPGGDKESVVWAKDDTEYLGLWWGGDRIYPTNGYGPKVAVHVGNEGGDDMTSVDPVAEPDVGVYVNVGNDHEWFFGPTGALVKGGEDGLVLGANYNVRIISDYSDNNRTWTFDGSAGNLVLPNATSIGETVNVTNESGAIISVNDLANATVTSNVNKYDGYITLPYDGWDAWVIIPAGSLANSLLAIGTGVKTATWGQGSTNDGYVWIQDVGDGSVEIAPYPYPGAPNPVAGTWYFPVSIGSTTVTTVDLQITTGTATWKIGQNGGLTFPDTTVQTTAYLTGQQTVYLNSATALTPVNLASLTGSVIVIIPEEGYTDQDTHNVTLSSDGIAVGTKISVINLYNGTVNFTGWPGPPYTIGSYETIQLICIADPINGGNYWWVTGSFTW